METAFSQTALLKRSELDHIAAVFANSLVGPEPIRPVRQRAALTAAERASPASAPSLRWPARVYPRRVGESHESVSHYPAGAGPDAARRSLRLGQSGLLDHQHLLRLRQQPGSPTPFKYSWNWSYAEGPPHSSVVIPSPCENRSTCTFRCPQENGGSQLLQIGVTVLDANNQLLGTGSSTRNCGRSDG
ncbi:hypothetical protein [Tahibacter aquaticus]|uniref:hypothetical protein n=1 Tax=Tahibacter aquaticus TaxID=520092 RepID=UPI00105FD38A|nr:hypothetical protein [Tahibacter aquaticus]